MDDETIFFDEVGVKVCKHSILIKGKTYPVTSISSVSFREIQPRYWLSYIALTAGIVLLLEEGSLFVVGGILSIFAIVSGLTAKTRYAVVIKTANAEKQLIASENAACIRQIIHAIDAAMANRYQSADTSATDKNSSSHEHARHHPSAAH